MMVLIGMHHLGKLIDGSVIASKDSKVNEQ